MARISNRPRKTDLPNIPLPDGDVLKPIGVKAREIGQAERGLRDRLKKAGIHLGLHAGCTFVSNREVDELIVFEVTGIRRVFTTGEAA